MLEIRTVCEHCNKLLPANSTEAMICSFECTFCLDCVSSILENVCPNCGGGFERRPIRPQSKLAQFPPSISKPYKPVDAEKFAHIKTKFREIPPSKR